MQQVSGVKEGGAAQGATPEQKALHLLAVWLEKDEARRAKPCDETKRAARHALMQLREQAGRLKQSSAKPD